MRREAASWLVRRQSARDTDIEGKFRQWYDAHPRHASAYDSVARSYDRAALLRHSPALRPSSRAPARRRQGRGAPTGYAAAAAIVLLMLATAVLVRGNWFSGGTQAVMLTTKVGEIRQVKLQDGSRVTLDTSTKLEVNLGRSQRRARLKSGRARFQIAQDARPFVVETAETNVTAARGVFDVELMQDERHVDVIAGSARVRAPGGGNAGGITLHAGDSVSVSGARTVASRSAAGAPDWTGGMLQFDGTPLADAVALANRYSERRIVIVGDVGQAKVTGAFRAGDTPGLARALSAAFDLSAVQSRTGMITLSTSARRSPKKNGG